MRFTVAHTLGVGMVLGALASVGPSIPIGHVQAQEAPSGTRDAPQLTEDEFQRLYDRITGIWDFQPDKSTYTRADPPTRLYVFYEADGGKAIKYWNRRLQPDGQEETTGVSRQVLDGRDYPTTPSGDVSIARLPLDEFTIETTSTRAGRQSGRNTQFSSADGQRMAVTVRRIDEKGEHVTQISVFDKIEKVD